jgi:hypothetical protein
MDNHLSYLYAVVQPLNRTLFNQAIIRTTTVELRDPIVLQGYLDRGFIYIRRLHYNYNHILRTPTDGCPVELTKAQDFGSMLIDSPTARKLIRRLCYF